MIPLGKNMKVQFLGRKKNGRDTEFPRFQPQTFHFQPYMPPNGKQVFPKNMNHTWFLPIKTHFSPKTSFKATPNTS